jgi:4-methyl-5(b-hydroxyethyl)-thiazole monophosphate biosynthesis
MNQALIFLAPGFEEVEMLTEVDMLRRAKLSIQMVSITDSLSVTGSHNVTIQADCLFQDADFDSSQMLILPGGMPGTLNLKAYQPLAKQIMAFHEAGKYLAAVCAAPTVFGELGLLNGKKATCYPGMEDGLVGAHFIAKPVVIDENIITSRGMGTCIPFASAIIEVLSDQATAEHILNAIVYH